eukprot:11536875-Alexandrium_andersonii.AAC.1
MAHAPSSACRTQSAASHTCGPILGMQAPFMSNEVVVVANEAYPGGLPPPRTPLTGASGAPEAP